MCSISNLNLAPHLFSVDLSHKKPDRWTHLFVYVFFVIQSINAMSIQLEIKCFHEELKSNGLTEPCHVKVLISISMHVVSLIRNILLFVNCDAAEQRHQAFGTRSSASSNSTHHHDHDTDWRSDPILTSYMQKLENHLLGDLDLDTSTGKFELVSYDRSVDKPRKRHKFFIVSN